jgi:hypothetical protein
MALPGGARLYVLAAGVLIGLMLVAAGALGLVSRGIALRKRFEGYAELPVFKDAELAEARLAIAERAVGTVPSLQMRANRAMREIDDARERIAASLFTVSTGVRLLFSLVFDER